MNKILPLIFCVIVFAVGNYYYKNIYVSPQDNPWTGQWQGTIPGLSTFTETQTDYFPQNFVLATICGYSNNRITASVVSKVFPSDYPKIKYLGVKGYYMATFKNKNGPDIQASFVLDRNDNEIEVKVLTDGKVSKLKDTTFVLKKKSSVANCGRSRSFSRRRF